VESRTPLGAADDAELARELEIVAMLRSRGAAFAPDAETKARAKQRLMAVLAAEQGGPRQAPPRPAAVPPAAAELTAPLGRRIEREDVDPSAETALMAPIAAADDTTSTSTANEEPADDATVVEPIPLHGPRSGRRARHSLTGRVGRSKRSAPPGLRGRVVFVGAAAAATLLAIASGGVLASSDALPGDTLYPVKRVAESAGVALTFDDASRARRHLEIAATRLSEVEQLAHNSQSAPAPEVFTSAMDDFDTATNEGSQLLLSAAEKDKGGTAADDLHKWAAAQSDRLAEVEPELPAAADANTSKELLERLLGQTGGRDADDNASRRTAGESTAEPDSEDSTEGSNSPDKEDSEDASKTDKPSRTPDKNTGRENPGLLPDLVPDKSQDEDEEPSGTASKDEDSTSKPDSDSDDGGDVSVPLPLLPPVTLPPLLPGLPGITIG
jgi:hypothetical protein